MIVRFLITIAASTFLTSCSNHVTSRNDLTDKFIALDQMQGLWVCGVNIESSRKIEVKKDAKLGLYELLFIDSSTNSYSKEPSTFFRVVSIVQDKAGSGAFVQVMTEKLRAPSEHGYYLGFLRIVSANEIRVYARPNIPSFQRAASPNQQIAGALGRLGIGTTGAVEYEMKEFPHYSTGEKQSIVVINSPSPQVRAWLASQNESLFENSNARCIR